MKLFPHQIRALEETQQYNKVGYFLDMGLGKTFVGSEKAISFGKSILLICQKSKVDDWFNHFVEFYSDKGFTFENLTNNLELEYFLEMTTKKDAALKVVGIINYELAFRRSGLLKLEDFTLMLDESSMITNPTAKRTKFVLKLKPENVILLSGTPTGGKYEKLWSQLKLLGWNISKDVFYQHYVVTEWLENDYGFKIPIITGYKNVDRLKDKLRLHGCIFQKTEEVFELPEQIIVPLKVANSKEYSKFMRNDMVVLKDGKTLVGDTVFEKRMYARMLCGQYSTEKLTAFKNLVESTDDRLIVFYNFNEELSRMKEIVEEIEKPISIVNGSIKELSAYENYSDSVTFIQYQAGSKGLNLQKANKIIYFTLPQGSEDFEQSKKRIHRIGQKNHCFYYLLMVKESIEEDILRTLKMRKDYDDELFRKYKERLSL